MDSMTTLARMERVLVLRGVPLLEDLTPEELQRVAAISTEMDMEDGEMICEQGEAGDQMFVIVSGEVRVVVKQGEQPEKEVARRGPRFCRTRRSPWPRGGRARGPPRSPRCSRPR